MGEYARAFDAAVQRDPGLFLVAAFREMDEAARAASISMFRDATARGDLFARRALDELARTQCRALDLLAGSAYGQNADRVAACADAMLSTVMLSANSADAEWTVRLAELAALLDAGIVTPYVVAGFCARAAEAKSVPDAFRPTVERLTATHCVALTPTDSTLAR